MLLEDAVALRIEQLCIERKITKYELSKLSGVPQTTLCSIKKKRSTSVKIHTLYAICCGLQISLEEFFFKIYVCARQSLRQKVKVRL